MKPLLLALLPAFIAGCSCDDNPSIGAPAGPQGGVTPMRQNATNDNPPIEIWTALDPSTCNADVTSAELKPPIFVSPILNPLGGRSFAVLLWSFCNPGRNVLPAQAPYKLLVSPSNLFNQQTQNDANCRGSRPTGQIGFPTECFPPVPTGDLSLTIALPALPSCTCRGEITFINVPAGQDSVAARLPPTERTTIPAGDYHFTLSAPWDVHVQDVEVVLK